MIGLETVRYFIRLSYKGTYYSGWQRQKEGIKTVQQVLEDTLSKMLGYVVTIHGCGRTDTGVHASDYYAHLGIEEGFTYDPVFRLNKMLPKDIVIYDIIELNPRANAQLDAIQRTYEYYLHRQKNPFLEEISTCYPESWDIPNMQKVVNYYTNLKDFKFFCKSPDQYDGDGRMVFVIKANRFLQGQIRLMVGRLMDVGIGKMTIEDFENYCKVGFPPYIHRSAKPQGLFLAGIKYKPELELDSKLEKKTI